MRKTGFYSVSKEILSGVATMLPLAYCVGEMPWHNGILLLGSPAQTLELFVALSIAVGRMVWSTPGSECEESF